MLYCPRALAFVPRAKLSSPKALASSPIAAEIFPCATEFAPSAIDNIPDALDLSPTAIASIPVAVPPASPVPAITLCGRTNSIDSTNAVLTGLKMPAFLSAELAALLVVELDLPLALASSETATNAFAA